MRYLLERIREQERKYGSELQPPLSEEDLRQCQEKTRSEPGVTLPEGSCNFLRQTDGLAWNGVHIYGSRRAPLAGHEGGEVMGLIEENLEWREMLADIAEYEHLLVLGFSDLDHYVYDLRTGQYVVKAGGSSDVFARYKTFEELFEHAARLALVCPVPGEPCQRLDRREMGTWAPAGDKLTMTLEQSDDRQPVPESERTFTLKASDDGCRTSVVCGCGGRAELRGLFGWAVPRSGPDTAYFIGAEGHDDHTRHGRSLDHVHYVWEHVQ